MDGNLVLSIRQIFLQKENTFIIPSYQRGYKWTQTDVCHLLDSIAEKLLACQSMEQYFSLQNITLCESERGFRVIDGQQRLITLTLILSQLNENIKSRIKFERRNKTESFINAVIQNHHLGDVDSLDEEYIYEAVEAIKEYLQKNKSFPLYLFLDKVKLIVNVISNNDVTEEQTFTNLNGIKTELDGADLLRAIFITRCENEVQTEHLLGKLFDEMNNWCKNEENHKYLTQLLSINKIAVTPIGKFDSYHARIIFDEKGYPIDLIYKLFFVLKRREKEEEFNYIFFEKLLSQNCQQIFSELRMLYKALKEWIKDRNIYHFLGFLIFNIKGADFLQIYDWWSSGKEPFLTNIKNKIREGLIADFKAAGFSISDLRNVCHQWYCRWGEDDGRMTALIHTLILQDVLLCTRHPEVGYLPVDYFTRKHDDVEHIACQTPNDKDCNDRDYWQLCISAMKDLEADSVDDSRLREDINVLEHTTIAEDAMEIINRYGLNSAGNLVLLERGLNRGYGNSVFESKRKQVTEAYFQNGKHRRKFIRPYTLKVFLSSSNKDGLVRWTFEDIRNNTQSLYDETNKWLKEQ